METLRNFAEDYSSNSPLIVGLFEVYPRLGATPIDELRNKYDEMCACLKEYARTLSSADRVELYKLTRDFTKELKEHKKLDRFYTLDKSFLSTPEIELAMIKYLHTPHTQDDLSEHFRCSNHAVQDWQADFRDGFRLGDMEIKVDFERGGALKSTVHPVLLPLNLTEVYSLLKVLKEAEHGNRCDPHGAIAGEIADKIYYQLSDYAKEKVDKLTTEAGLDFYDDLKPVFTNEDAENVEHARSINWAFIEKAHMLVKVIQEDGTTLVGYIHSSRYRPSEFVLETQDGDIALRWDEILDIENIEQRR